MSATLCVRRRRNCCVAMADAWARATGKIGIASVTCGPGYTQIMTALAMAARGTDRRVLVHPVDRSGAAGAGNRRTFRADPHDRPGARLRARSVLRRPRREKAGGAQRAA